LDDDTTVQPVATQTGDQAARVNEFVEQWFADTLANSVATQSGSLINNRLIAAKDELKRRIAEEF
jgi:hypothetical protein